MTSSNHLIKIAKKYIGCNEFNDTHYPIIDGYNSITPRPRNYKLKYTDAWCAAFVSFIAYKSNNLDIIPAECSCKLMLDLCKSMGIFIEDESVKSHLGDIVFYDWQDDGKGDNKGWPDHVGITIEATNDYFVVIEGNKNGRVGTRTLLRNSRYLRGFARPQYSDAVGPKVEDVYADLDTIVRAVIRGDFGNGSERTSRLMALGFDPNNIQKVVNKILKG